MATKQYEVNNVEKLQRKYLQEQQRKIKPGECIKYIRCKIDTQIVDSTYGSQILSQLDINNIKYVKDNQKVSKVISWERSNQQTFSGNNCEMTNKFNLESQIIYIITPKDLWDAIREHKIKKLIKQLHENYPFSIVTMLINGQKNFYPKSNKYEIEKILTEIQIEYNCCHRYNENPAEIAQTIVQFSKAIAEIPFKKQQVEKINSIDAFLLNDNKDCVRVEGTAGLPRLWKSHLTRLPLVTLEVAETIISHYSNPSQLLTEYKNANDENSLDLLRDLKIKRSFESLQTNKKIGPELSRKIYTLYNSLNPNEIL